MWEVNNYIGDKLYIPEIPEPIIKLPPRIFKVVKNKHIPGGWDLEEQDTYFKVPSKIYGKLNSYTDIIFNSYKRRGKTTAAMFTGLKGSGKTELAKLLANRALENGMAVVMVSEVTPNDDLLRYLSNLRDCLLFLDEFGKMFNRAVQAKMLTMLSDLLETNKLILLTENSKYMIDDFILNRPGRVLYHIEFKRIEEDVVREFCNDNRVDSRFIDTLVSRYKRATKFTMDHLSAVVKEHLRYPDLSFDELVGILNIDSLKVKTIYKPLHITSTDKNNEDTYELVTDKITAGQFNNYDGMIVKFKKVTSTDIGVEDVKNEEALIPTPGPVFAHGSFANHNSNLAPDELIQKFRKSEIKKIEGKMTYINNGKYILTILEGDEDEDS